MPRSSTGLSVFDAFASLKLNRGFGEASRGFQRLVPGQSRPQQLVRGAEAAEAAGAPGPCLSRQQRTPRGRGAAGVRIPGPPVGPWGGHVCPDPLRPTMHMCKWRVSLPGRGCQERGASSLLPLRLEGPPEAAGWRGPHPWATAWRRGLHRGHAPPQRTLEPRASGRRGRELGGGLSGAPQILERVYPGGP